jgi:hypothetical protein
MEGLDRAALQSVDFRPQERWQQAMWLRCPNCEQPIVRTADRRETGPAVYPSALPGREIAGLPVDVARAWWEARSAHSVGAYTASEAMCCKILMRLAINVAKATPGKTFVEYVTELENNGYVMAGIKPLVDQVKGRGNPAEPLQPASTEPDSDAALQLAEHLLAAIYELPNLGRGGQPRRP